MSGIPARALHFVFKIGDRAKNAHFFRNILGMKVLRHEEFKEGCEAQCNGPYDNRWSKTMLGYGPESSHFVVELTYNYGVTSYALGNDFGGMTIKSKETLERARAQSYPITKEAERNLLISPDGYKFYIIDEKEPKDADPVVEVCLHVSDLEQAKKFWQQYLQMRPICCSDCELLLHYADNQAELRLRQIASPINRAAAYGRIAFAVPKDILPVIAKIMKEVKGTVIKPLVELETPGKANVTVIILADPNGHEICFVDAEGFSELSQFQENGNAQLDKYIGKDPFQPK